MLCMEADNDPRLKRLLNEWRIPNPPERLDDRVFRRMRPWWRTFMSAQVRVPLPVALAFCVALFWLVAVVSRDRTTVVKPVGITEDLQGFQPVNTVRVRIERNRDAAQ